MRPQEMMRPYQVEAADRLAAPMKAAAYWKDMGLGKTVSTLTAAGALIDEMEVRRALVVAPLRVARSVWRQEAAEWEHLAHLNIQFVDGSPKRRIEQLNNPNVDIHVINYEKLIWLVESYLGLSPYEPMPPDTKCPWDLLIWDESAKMKNMGTRRAGYVRRMMPLFEYRWGLTGTPKPNGYSDLFGQIFFLDSGERLGVTKSNYLKRFFREKEGRFVIRNEWTAEQLMSVLEPIVLRYAAEDYVDVTEPLVHEIWVDMPKENIKEYESLERDFFLEIDTAKVEAFNAAALSSKCHQYAGGALYTGEEREWLHRHDAKMDAFEDVVEEAEGAPLLVMYQFQHELQRLLKKYPDAETFHGLSKTKEADLIKRWNEGNIPILLGHPNSMGHGLNIQHGSHRIVWFGITWNLEHYQQAVARLAGGLRAEDRDHPVIITRILTRGTIDEALVSAVERKASDQRALLDAIREYAAAKRKRAT